MTETSQVSSVASVLPVDRFLDRELSWLAFNQRVLELAQDPDMELLERVKYLSIFASNLDEFFMVRVAGLKRRLATGIARKTISGMLPTEVHNAVLAESYAAMKEASKTFNDSVLPALVASGIEILRWEELTTDEREAMSTLFDEQVFPVLTPLAVDLST